MSDFKEDTSPITTKEMAIKDLPPSFTLENDDATEYEMVELSHSERIIVEEHERLSPHLIFEIIRRDGLDEMQRPLRSLIFSGIVAGIVISFSFFCNAILAAMLPPTPWNNIIAKFGYTVGFIIVILGRMQLFTENTITTVVPVLKPFNWSTLTSCARVWGIVFISNLIGTTIAAVYLSNTSAINPNFMQELLHISEHVANFTAMQNIIRGIPAGILIASLVWMLPSSRSFSIFLIGLITYFIALGDFTHVVVGSTELAFAVLHGKATLADYFFRFLIPTGLGNVIGGTGIFTILVYGQIKEELPLIRFRCAGGHCSLEEQELRAQRKKKGRNKNKAEKLLQQKLDKATKSTQNDMIKVEVLEKK